MIAKEVKRYSVTTNGLSGKCSYRATDPDEALLFAVRHERFLRIRKSRPDIPVEKLRQIVKDECEMPDFRIESCILEKDD